MWTQEQRRRYEILCQREQTGALTEEEAAELAALVQLLEDEEARYLAPANEQKAREVAELAAAVERLEIENRQLREYLSERAAFRERVRSVVTHLQAEDQEMRDRLAAVLRSGDGPV
jgi:regulator of replication initiation timing